MQTTLVALTALAACLPSAAAHGYVSGIVSGGKYYQGQSPSWYYQNKAAIPPSAGWQALNQDNGFVAPSSYGSQDISCHKSATTGKAYVNAVAGSTIQLQWGSDTWPSSHHGPIINYLAACPGDCTAIKSSDLKFFKIEATGLIDDTTVPGNWATDKLIANNNTATLTIPKGIKSGGYVLRHEIIALHSAGTAGGAQNYPQCINLQITGGTGSSTPAGVAGTKLYTENENGIVFNIYQSISSYPIPGPAIASLAKKVRSVFTA